MTTTAVERSDFQSGTMGAPSGPRASLPSASRRSGVSIAKRSICKSAAMGAPSGPRASLPSASRRSGVSIAKRSVDKSRGDALANRSDFQSGAMGWR